MAPQTEVEFVWAKNFRENVRRIVAERGMTFSRLAERLGYDRSSITITLNSDTDRIGSDTIERWAWALEVDPAELVKNPEVDA